MAVEGIRFPDWDIPARRALATVFVGVLSGRLLGLFAFAAFLLLSQLLVPQGIGFGFRAALVIVVAVQGASLWIGRRLALA